jgi:hypothetical protein
MPVFAEVYNKGGTDKTVILNVRSWVRQPFQAPGWRDLRVGFLLSVTDDTADDTITGLAETIPSVDDTLYPSDRYWIGVKDRSPAFPHNNSTSFIGFSNIFAANGPATRGGSVLASSDIAAGTGTTYWRPTNSLRSDWSGFVIDATMVRSHAKNFCQQHFVQDIAAQPLYATLLMLRLTRKDANSRIITTTTKSSGQSADVLFTNTPTEDLLLSNLQAFPTSVQQWGPNLVRIVPEALFLYWPFRQSRLRIHAMGFLKAR